jgi:hypothetical protein
LSKLRSGEKGTYKYEKEKEEEEGNRQVEVLLCDWTARDASGIWQSGF